MTVEECINSAPYVAINQIPIDSAVTWIDRNRNVFPYNNADSLMRIIPTDTKCYVGFRFCDGEFLGWLHDSCYGIDWAYEGPVFLWDELDHDDDKFSIQNLDSLL